MSEHYHDAGDLHFLKEMGKLAPADFKAWLGLNNIVGSENGKIPKKYRELIADRRGLHNTVSLLHRGAFKSGQGGRRNAGRDRRIGIFSGSVASRRSSYAWRDGAQVF